MPNGQVFNAIWIPDSPTIGQMDAILFSYVFKWSFEIRTSKRLVFKCFRFSKFRSPLYNIFWHPTLNHYYNKLLSYLWIFLKWGVLHRGLSVCNNLPRSEDLHGRTFFKIKVEELKYSDFGVTRRGSLNGRRRFQNLSHSLNQCRDGHWSYRADDVDNR